VLLGHNESERFESRFVTVRIEKSKAIMFKNMEESVLGVWVAHGEGKIHFLYLNCVTAMLNILYICLCYI